MTGVPLKGKSMSTFQRSLVVCFTALFILAAVCYGQSFTASIRGVVTDASQAAVPGATVIAKDVERNIDHPTTSDAQGRYVITNLPPGSYTLTVEAAGFQRYSASAFTLVVQQQATMDIRLNVGEVTTTVEVESAAPLLNTTIANLGQVIENKYII